MAPSKYDLKHFEELLPTDHGEVSRRLSIETHELPRLEGTITVAIEASYREVVSYLRDHKLSVPTTAPRNAKYQ
jgi:hypothetical protein